MNSLIWKGVSSTTIKGLLICELPPISKPAMRVKETTVDGRDGSIIEELGYEPYDKNVVIGLHGDFDINKVIKYFTGDGEVVFSNEPDKVYTAKIVGHIDYTRLLRFRQATIPFRVQPFKRKLYEAYKETPTEVVSGTSIVINDGADAKFKAFSIYGKTTQNGTPAPDAPVELVSVGDGGSITVSVADAEGNVQSIVVQTPNGLRGIPVSSGGNYTDANGQQWVCDEVDFARGVYVQRITKVVFDANSTKIYGSDQTITQIPATNVRFEFRNESVTNILQQETDKKQIIMSNYGVAAQRANYDGVWINSRGYFEGRISVASSIANSVDELKTYLAIEPIVFIVPLAEPVETPLSEEELTTYADLHTYRCDKTVSNNASANMCVEYFKTYEVFNEGLETSKPIMVLKGEGTVVISVNGLQVFSYTFPEGENEVVIDSEKEDAYLGDVLKNRHMNGEFPDLLPGTNIIEWSGNVSSIDILPRSRWI